MLHGVTAGNTNPTGNSTPRSVAHTLYDKLPNLIPKYAAAAKLMIANKEKAWTYPRLKGSRNRVADDGGRAT